MPAITDQTNPLNLDDADPQKRVALIRHERAEIEQLTVELTKYSYAQLVQKYGREKLLGLVLMPRPVSNLKTIQNVDLLRNYLIFDFLPENNQQIIKTLSSKTKEKIINLIAALKPEHTPQQIEAWLKEIDPNLILPNNFQVNDFQPRAYELYNAIENIKKAIADSLTPEIFTDTSHFTKYSVLNIKHLYAELQVISQKLEFQYQKLLHNQPVDDQVLNEAVDFLAKTGRLPLIIEEVRSGHNLAGISDLILKVNSALKIAMELKSQNPNRSFSDEEIHAAIKNYLTRDLDPFA